MYVLLFLPLLPVARALQVQGRLRDTAPVSWKVDPALGLFKSFVELRRNV